MSTNTTSPKHGDAVDLALDGFGTLGQADREIGPRRADRQTVAADEDLSPERAG